MPSVSFLSWTRLEFVLLVSHFHCLRSGKTNPALQHCLALVFFLSSRCPVHVLDMSWFCQRARQFWDKGKTTSLSECTPIHIIQHGKRIRNLMIKFIEGQFGPFERAAATVPIHNDQVHHLRISTHADCPFLCRLQGEILSL